MALTLAEYAQAKMLPVEHLRRLGVRDVDGDEAQKIMNRWVPASAAVAFPYYSIDGELQYERLRWSMDEKPCQPKGQKVTTPYGLAWLSVEKRSDLLIVEGESDTQTALFYGLAVLGIPGATTFKSSWAPVLASYRKVFVWDDGDDAAIKLIEGVAAVHPNVHVLLVSGVKDASELHLARPSTFRAEVVKAARCAPKAEPPPPPQPRPQRRGAPSRDRRHITLVEAMAGVVTDVDRLDDVRRGQQAFVLCPFHSDTRPSLHVDPEGDVFCCFVCGAQGGVKDFIERAGLDWREVKRDRIRRANGVPA